MSETPDHPVLSADQARAVAALSRALLAATRIWAMYPPEHPAVRAAVGRLQDSIGEALEARVASSIGVTPDALLVRGLPLPPGDPSIVQVAALLHAQGVIEIGFDPFMPAEAPAALLAFIGRAPGSFDDQGGIAEAWHQQGHPGIRLVAVDYQKVLEDHDPEKAARRDDVWRSIVSALASGRRALDEREQQRLLELAEDPGELAALADTLTADKCTAAGSPMVTTQAATVLASFRHLASIASVLAPDRAQAILKNLASALAQIDPRVSMQIITMEGQGGTGDATLSGALSEDGVAQLLAKVLALEGQASPRVGHVFDLLVPDPGRRRDVLDRARSLAQAQYSGDRPFDSLWNSIEELLLSYNDQAYVGNEYRAVLDGAGGETGGGDQSSAPPVEEMNEWLGTVGEDHLRLLSITMLADLLQIETQADRAIVVLNQLADLAGDLLIAGAYEDALRAIEAIEQGGTRGDLTTAAVQAMQRIATSDGARETAAVLGDLRPAEWTVLEQCYRRLGPSCLDTLHGLLLAPEATRAAERAGDVFVAMGEEAVPVLTGLLADSPPSVCHRLATLLGRIALPSAVPGLQNLLRASDPRVVQAAIRALAGIDDASAVRAIHVALRSAEGRARQMVVDALVAVADRRVVPMLVRVLDASRPLGPDYQVVLHVLDALARLRDARAVRAIGVVLFVRRWFLRTFFSRRRLRTLKYGAARALVQIGDPAGLQLLDRARRSGDRILRRVARDLHLQAVEGAA